MNCQKCGKTIGATDKFCEYCGAKQELAQKVTPTPAPVEEEPAAEISPNTTNEPAKAPKKKGGAGKVVLTVILVIVAVLVLGALVIGGVACGGCYGCRSEQDMDNPSVVWVPSNPLDDFLGAFTPQTNETLPSTAQTEPTVTTTATQAAKMPSLTGVHYEDAVEFLEAEGVLVELNYVFSDAVEADYVVEQSVAVGTTLYDGLKVTLTVSKGEDVCPYEYSQKVTVSANSGSSSATLILYNWENGDWKETFRCAATVGQKGIGAGYGEGAKTTPLGTFKLGVILSDSAVSNATWPVQYVTSDTCVVDDVNSPYYNTIRNISSLPAGVHYDSIGNTIIGGYTDLCIYIEHNGDGYSSDGVVPGKGSVITICSKPSSLAATAGCIDIATADMNKLIELLDYEKNTHIETKVN